MTIEEAISIMKVIVHMLEPQYDTDRIEDAVDMAIKALEQLQEVKDMIIAETTIIYDDDGAGWRVVLREDIDEVLGKGWDK